MIKIKNLVKKYYTDEIETTALNHINVDIHQGDFVAIMGPSGSGKSTLLNILGLLDSPSDGQYFFGDHEVSKYKETQLADIRKANIGFIFQSFNLIDELTVSENIELPMQYLGISASERKKRSTEIMEQMQIAHRRNHYPHQLSGGQQQRVAISRAVIAKPKLILADEPTGNLDSVNGKEVMNVLVELNKTGTSVIMVTHSERDAAYSKRILHLLDGQLQENGVTTGNSYVTPQQNIPLQGKV